MMLMKLQLPMNGWRRLVWYLVKMMIVENAENIKKQDESFCFVALHHHKDEHFLNDEE